MATPATPTSSLGVIEQARERWIFVRLGYYHELVRFNRANGRPDLTAKEREFLTTYQAQARTVIPTLRNPWTRQRLEWDAHDYRTEEELRSIVADLKRIKDDSLSRYRARSLTLGSGTAICDSYFSDSQRATWCFARCDLADLKEARDNKAMEGFFLNLYRTMMAENPCPHGTPAKALDNPAEARDNPANEDIES